MRKSPSYYREIVGQTFGHWLVLERRPNRRRKAYYLCRCSCGVEREVIKCGLEDGKTTNCGHVHKPKQNHKEVNCFKRWTEEEKELIRLWYPVNGSRYLKKILGRSRTAVSDMAYELGVKNNNPTAMFFNPARWHKWEVEALIKYYPLGGVTACLTHIPDRSKDAIRIKARKLGIRANIKGKSYEERKAYA